MKKFLICFFISAILATPFFYWIFFLNHIDINEVGIFYNSIDSTINVRTNPGWYKTSFFVKEISISTLPIKISPTYNNQYPSIPVINEKVVRFNPKGSEDFIKLNGFSYTTSLYLKNLMTAYAYSGQKYSFLDIIQEYNGTIETK